MCSLLLNSSILSSLENRDIRDIRQWRVLVSFGNDTVMLSN
jgi:hypothetical protein